MITGNLRVRAICNDQSIYSCNVSLGSFCRTKDTANCKGIMKLYLLDNSSKNLHVHVAMRIFNVDRIHPTVFHRSVLAVNRNTQTDWCRMNRQVQMSVTMRHVAIQTKDQKLKNKKTQVKEKAKHVTMKDAAVQLSKRISRQQLTEIIAEIISHALAVNEKNRQLGKHSGNKLSVAGENSNQFSSPSRKRNNLSKKPMKKSTECFNKAKCQRLPMKLPNLIDDCPKLNIERFCNKPRITNGSNKSRSHCYANIFCNRSNSYNSICQQQLLRKLDQLITKQIMQQKMHAKKSNKLSDASKNSKQKMERLCQMSAIPSHRSDKRSISARLSFINKNISNVSMLNNCGSLTKSTNQNLIQKSINNKSSDKNSNCSNPKATISEYNSGSTARQSIGKLKKNLTTERRRNSSHAIKSESNPETLSDISSDIDYNDENSNAENDNGKSSTARTVSSEFSNSNEISPITELHSIK
uniref:Bm10782 n=1 Tax=Brugia malayi TaxID=6279 RepID=A0A7I4K3H7_BRUMA